MGKINSKQKGKIGELEVVHELKDAGFNARRGQQFHGGPDSPDVIVDDLTWVHLEVKRVEKGSPYEWLAQAQRDAGLDQIPVVIHRKRNKPWIAILDLAQLIHILKQVPR